MSTLLLVQDRGVQPIFLMVPPVADRVHRGTAAVSFAVNVILGIRLYALYGHNRKGGCGVDILNDAPYVKV